MLSSVLIHGLLPPPTSRAKRIWRAGGRVGSVGRSVGLCTREPASGDGRPNPFWTTPTQQASHTKKATQRRWYVAGSPLRDRDRVLISDNTSKPSSPDLPPNTTSRHWLVRMWNDAIRIMFCAGCVPASSSWTNHHNQANRNNITDDDDEETTPRSQWMLRTATASVETVGTPSILPLFVSIQYNNILNDTTFSHTHKTEKQNQSHTIATSDDAVSQKVPVLYGWTLRKCTGDEQCRKRDTLPGVSTSNQRSDGPLT